MNCILAMRPIMTLAAAAPRATRNEVEVTPVEPRKPFRERPARPVVDLSAVSDEHWEIHRRLENWARWCDGASGEKARKAEPSPMFSLYRSTEARRAYGEETAVPIDKDDALKIHFAIVHPTFDPQARKALQWCYLRPKDPAGAARDMGTDIAGLLDLILAGRALLIERGA
jgi:hypothetical protein